MDTKPPTSSPPAWVAAILVLAALGGGTWLVISVYQRMNARPVPTHPAPVVAQAEADQDEAPARRGRAAARQLAERQEAARQRRQAEREQQEVQRVQGRQQLQQIRRQVGDLPAGLHEIENRTIARTERYAFIFPSEAGGGPILPIRLGEPAEPARARLSLRRLADSPDRQQQLGLTREQVRQLHQMIGDGFPRANTADLAEPHRAYLEAGDDTQRTAAGQQLMQAVQERAEQAEATLHQWRSRLESILTEEQLRQLGEMDQPGE